MKIPALIRLIKPHQWIKNTFIFAPLLFSGLFTDISSVQNSIFIFLLFCLASSAVYVFNDYCDIESDKKHPIKSTTRPLASGEVSKNEGILVMLSLYGLSVISIFIYPQVGFFLGLYLILNIAYSLYLKHKPILDIFSIAVGFILRIYAGSAAINVPLSSWMFITTMSLALYLILIKRRQELFNYGNTSRKVLEFYSIKLIDKFANISALSSIISYSLFIMYNKTGLVFTIAFVLFGFYRYWFIVNYKNLGESPVKAIMSDRLLQLTVLGWICSCVTSVLIFNVI